MTKLGMHCYISGKVQGVFYRQNTKEQAEARNLTGWVKNLADGRVEAMLYGQQDNIIDMLSWLETGPTKAKVTQVDSFTVEYQDVPSFTIIRE